MDIFPGITRVAAPFLGVLLDAYGVFWGGNAYGFFPGAHAAMEKLVSSGKIVGVLSNSTHLAIREVDKLRAHGMEQGKHFHFFVTSGEVARHIFLEGKLPFQTPRNTFWLFGEPHPKYAPHSVIFQGSRYRETKGIDEADFIYVATPHILGNDQTNVELFREATEALKVKNLPMVCPNPDQFAHEGNPPKAVVRQGSLAALYEALGGQVFYVGKPNSTAYAMAMECFNQYGIHEAKHILMVGDTPETDIRGARHYGMSSALMIETGIMADRIAQCGLEAAVDALNPRDRPDYFIARFADDL